MGHPKGLEYHIIVFAMEKGSRISVVMCIYLHNFFPKPNVKYPEWVTLWFQQHRKQDLPAQQSPEYATSVNIKPDAFGKSAMQQVFRKTNVEKL